MKKIGIPLNTQKNLNRIDHYLSTEYTKAIEDLDGLPILLPYTRDRFKIVEQVVCCDGFLMPGGDDITPYLYEEEPLPGLGECNEKVDEYHIRITTEIVAQNKPFLGICRGAQILNVALGGNVYQDIKHCEQKLLLHQQTGQRYDLCHQVHFEPGTKLYNLFGEDIMVNSFHHQAISKVSNKLIISGQTSDGIVEAVESETLKFCIGVQWHPEIMLYNNGKMNKLFKAFLASC
ncbi:MAG: hypothetical protein ATN31_02325 [Candidatus Epulonipiscioides saccharophilum]|nr:MAG: hypothetical protein ATN31_02325 [Epulopiscium sp. AS2M-Bin001]